MITDADVVVPLGPITSTGSLTVPGVLEPDPDPDPDPEPDEVGVSVTVDVALLVGSAALVAVTVTVWPALTVGGAVYTPLTRVPTAGLIVHVAALFEVPVIKVKKVALWLAWSEAVPGDKLMLTTGGGGAFGLGCNVKETDPLLLGSATLTAVSTISCGDEMAAGAE